ncbi:MAG: DUF2459 domain-containing protein [Nitrospira sp.]|nr:DUF2459 domain-containing protein [Nitrospira sp.]
MTSVMAVVLAFTATVLLSACASPIEGLWPPPPDAGTKTIAASLDTWHAVIAFPRKKVSDVSALRSQHIFEERGYAECTPQPPSDLFTFRLTEEGYQRLHRHLHATLLSEEPVSSISQSVFYPSKRSYHLLHTCHQYAAHALRETGLPLSPFWAFSRISFAWQLQRAAKIAESDGRHQVRMKGSHRQLHHPMKKGTVMVAGQPNVNTSLGTLNSAFK